MEGAQPLLKYGIERRLARHDLSTAEGRSRAMAEALQVLAPIKDSLLAKDYAVQIAGRVRAREEDALEALSRLTPPARTEEAAAAQGAGAAAGGTPGPAVPDRALPVNAAGAQSPAVRARVSVHGRALSGMGPLVRRRRSRRRSGTARRHAAVAAALLDVLAEAPGITAAEAVARAGERDQRATRVLTAGTMADAEEPEVLMPFLAEELALGDAEDQIAALQEQLKHPEELGAEGAESLFATVMALRQDLSSRRFGARGGPAQARSGRISG